VARGRSLDQSIAIPASTPKKSQTGAPCGSPGELDTSSSQGGRMLGRPPDCGD
jgi:hypothetical protein